MTGRRFAAEIDELDEVVRPPARALLDDDADLASSAGGELEAFAPNRPRRRLLALVAAPVVALALAGSAYAVTRPSTDPGLQAQPAPVSSTQVASVPASQPSAARSVAPNRAQQRPALTPSAPGSAAGASAGDLRPAGAISVPGRAATTTRPTVTSTTPSSSPADKPAAEPTVALGEVIGTRYTTTGVNVRALPSTTAEVLETLNAGAQVRITAVTRNGFRQINYDGRAAWVSAELLTNTKPVQKASTTSTSTNQTSTTTSDDGGSDGGTNIGASDASCSKSPGVTAGLTSAAASVYRTICANFPAVTSFGGYRAGDGEHGTGRALDSMVTGDAGWAIANWARANASRFGITQVIYQQKIWTTQRGSEGWRSMSDRGSTTANHYDHVHITVGG